MAENITEESLGIEPLSDIESDKLYYYDVDCSAFRLEFYVEFIQLLGPEIVKELIGVKETEITFVQNGQQSINAKLVTTRPLTQEDIAKYTNGYFGNIKIGENIKLSNTKELAVGKKLMPLRFNVSEKMSQEFCRAVADLNPNANISFSYNSEIGTGKLESNVPLGDLNYPIGYYGAFGVDKDGFIGRLNDRVNSYIPQAPENAEEYRGHIEPLEVTKKYFENISVIEMLMDETLDNAMEETNKGVNKQPKINSSTALKVGYNKDLLAIEIQKRKFSILQRERTMTEASKARNRSAIIAGLCILGAAAAVLLKDANLNNVIQQELSSIYSWESFGDYLQSIGPMSTLLTIGAAECIRRYFKNARILKKAQNEFIDFNASMGNSQIMEVDEDVKAR